MALEALLEDLRQPLVVASSGEEALGKTLKDDFAVILLDVLMPGMDGFETAKLIRERRQSAHTPIIFLTGASEDLPSMFRGYEAGAVDYIVKPVNPEVLKSKIAVFIDLFVKSQELEKRDRRTQAGGGAVARDPGKPAGAHHRTCSRCGKRSRRASRARSTTSWGRP